MAARKGIKIDTFAVYSSDEFEVVRQVNADGYFLGLHHKEVRDNPQEIGEVRAAYAVATNKEWQQPMIEIVWRNDIEKIRQNSASPGSPAWKSWYSEMARKTAVNRLAKRLPLFVEVKEESGDKVSIPLGGIPNEDTYYEGRVGNATIDAPIDGKPKEEDKGMVLIKKAMEIRSEIPDIYQQVVGRRDVTKLRTDQLSDLLDKVEEIGSFAESQSASELVEHTSSKDEPKPVDGAEVPWNESDELGF
jgi:hypothetical protein